MNPQDKVQIELTRQQAEQLIPALNEVPMKGYQSAAWLLSVANAVQVALGPMEAPAAPAPDQSPAPVIPVAPSPAPPIHNKKRR